MHIVFDGLKYIDLKPISHLAPCSIHEPNSPEVTRNICV
jgi:hypothetical protein